MFRVRVDAVDRVAELENPGRVSGSLLFLNYFSSNCGVADVVPAINHARASRPDIAVVILVPSDWPEPTMRAFQRNVDVRVTVTKASGELDRAWRELRRLYGVYADSGFLVIRNATGVTVETNYSAMIAALEGRL